MRRVKVNDSISADVAQPSKVSGNLTGMTSAVFGYIGGDPEDQTNLVELIDSKVATGSSSGVAQEKAERIAADSLEASTRLFGDQNLSDRISNEALARQYADNTKVDKEEGKGLSTNDYTSNDKNKLHFIEYGAQVNLVNDVKVNGTSVMSNKTAFVDLSAYDTIANRETAVEGLKSYTNTKLATKVDKNNSITPGTSTKITYDAKGLVTAGTSLSESDIPQIHLSKISDVTANAAELNYVDGVTSPIQSQLDSKVAKNNNITAGTATKITYDAKGLVTGGTSLSESDIPNIHLSKISDVTATPSELNILDGATLSTEELNYVDGVTSSIQTQLNNKEPLDNTILKQADVIDNVTSVVTNKPLSANQGKVLQDRIDNISTIGKFLAIWNAVTGLPTSDPQTLPYTYHTGDYYRVGVVNETSEGVNYMPDGEQYTGAPSTTEYHELLGIGDVFYYDGTNWLIQASAGGGKVQDVCVDGQTILSGGIANITANNLPELPTSKITSGVFDVVRIPDITISKVSDITATANELNILDGATLTTTELNYVDGVTSSIQTQLDNKVVKNDDITAGTHTKITYDTKGLVTSGTDLVESDIPSLHLSKVTDVTATVVEVNKLHDLATTSTELGYVHGVTSGIQTQLNGKQALLSAQTSYTDKGTATKVAQISTNSLGQVTNINEVDIAKTTLTDLGITATATELNYVDGVTSNIQTQLDSKQANLPEVTNDRYLHTNSSTGALEWSEVHSGVTSITANNGLTGNSTTGDIVIGMTNPMFYDNIASSIPVPINADTLQSHPANYFQSALTVNPASPTTPLTSIGINGTNYSLGSVADVKVNGTSVVQNRIANISMMTFEEV